MSDNRIHELLAAKPKSRLVDLSDRLDQDPADVSAALSSLIAVGEVVEADGLAPNGVPCKVYDLSDTFKAAEGYAVLQAKARAMNFTAAPGLNRIERALAFIRQYGSASTSELHIVMGLTPDEYASTALASAVRTSRLIKDGKTWTIGPGPAGSAAPRPPAVEAKPAVSAPGPFDALLKMPTPEPTSAPTAAPTEAPTAAPTVPQAAAPAVVEIHAPTVTLTGHLSVAPVPAQPGTPAAPVYRCALWSDDILEVQRDGVTVVEVEKAAGESLAAFLTRLAGAREAA
jgi:hypothetical protein